MRNQTKQRLKYLLTDLLTTAVGWTVFYVYRFDVTGHLIWSSLAEFMTSEIVLFNLSVSPLVWCGLFAFSGYYQRPFLKSHLEDLQTTFLSVVVGTLIYFFAIVIDDVPWVNDEQLYIMKVVHVAPRVYVQILVTMFSCVFLPVYLGRYVITHLQHRAIQSGKAGLRTLMVGTGRAAQNLRRELDAARRRDGYKIVADIPQGAPFSDVQRHVVRNDIEAVLLALDQREPRVVFRTIHQLLPFERPIRLRASEEDMMNGLVRTGSLTALPMLEYGPDCLSPFRRNTKRLVDIVVAAMALVVLLPVFLILAILIKVDSRGPVFYRQERIGRCGHAFQMYKLRTMQPEAEQDGPQLTTADDKRITGIGKTLRKYRLDELPQFWNILKGDMSLVGPRPERDHFIQKIMDVAPHYTKLLQVRPGLTSWGMVKYGYASTIFEMIERMRYDMMYLDNCTLVMDLKIIGYTIRTVLTGQGI